MSKLTETTTNSIENLQEKISNIINSSQKYISLFDDYAALYIKDKDLLRERLTRIIDNRINDDISNQ